MKPEPSPLETVFKAHSTRVLGLAYRMLGSRADAEDVLQETWIRVSASTAEVENPEAFLVTVATRLCLDHLKSARVRRETYVGPWLPEPVLSVESFSPETAAALADDLSFALLLTLQTLTPPERAAFLLHDVFDLPFSEIAATLGKSEAACRQLAARARKAVKAKRRANSVSPDECRTLTTRFFETLETGDLDALKNLLRTDAVLYSDGGGVKISALNPIRGDDKVARFFLGIARKSMRRRQAVDLAGAEINGQPGALIFVDGLLDQTLSIDVVDGQIAKIYVVRNPEKLENIEPGSEWDRVTFREAADGP